MNIAKNVTFHGPVPQNDYDACSECGHILDPDARDQAGACGLNPDGDYARVTLVLLVEGITNDDLHNALDLWLESGVFEADLQTALDAYAEDEDSEVKDPVNLNETSVGLLVWSG